jgi:protocatechuate 3,4-dioxygenase beta subunit
MVEPGDDGRFRFYYIPAGIYTLRTLETLGYQDACYNPEDQTVEEPTFQLEEGQRTTANIEVEPVRPYHRIAGRILGEDGKPITDCEGLIVYAWWQRTQGQRKGQYQRISVSSVNEDGGYLLENLDARAVYVQVYDRDAPNKDNPYPPRFYPGTFSRAQAKLITSEDKEIVENVDIPMKRTGGLVLEGVVIDDSAGTPVSEALVSIFHHDMTFDLSCGYTDKQGRYRIEGLGEGRFMVHVDAVHKGLIKTRKVVTIEPDSQETHLDFTLRRGVTITGRLVDQNGAPWKDGAGYGSSRAKRQDSQDGGGSALVYGNKYAPTYIREGPTAFYVDGQGDVPGVRMVFPTESSFLLPAMVPGKITIDFRPRGKGERLLKIVYQGQDISKTGLATEAGQKIDDVTIVIGTSGSNRQSRAPAGDRLEFTLYDAFGRQVRSQDYKGVPIFLEFGACW